MHTTPSLRHRRTAGFSLIEVLIALVILSVGLLGIAGMVAASMKSKDSSYMRTQATALTSVILDRMRANRATATAGSYDIAIGTAPTAPPSDDCTTTACTPGQIANLDLTLWKNDLASILPSGDGSIATLTNNQMTQVTISVQWNDQRAVKAVEGAATTAAPVAATLTFSTTSGL